MVITKWGAIITLPNIYGRDFLQKLVNYFRQKSIIIDVRQGPEYASVWKKNVVPDKNEDLYTVNTFKWIHYQTSREILK